VTTPPRRLAPGDRRRQIIDATRDLLDEKQLKEVTVEEAARRAGVSPGLVFHYFGNRRGFRRAIADELSADLLGYLAPDPALSHTEQLRSALEVITSYVEQHPALYLAVTRVSTDNHDLGEVHAGILGTISEWVRGGLYAAGVPDTPALTAAVSGWIAFTEDVLFGWITGSALKREDIVSLCENACYHLVQVAVGDPARWDEIAARLARAHDPVP
jgi:AcrR family transcriptional regulator